MIVCSGYKCKCRKYVFARKTQHYDFCECTHTLNNHSEGNNERKTVDQEERKEPPREEKPARREIKARKPKRAGAAPVSTSKTGLTPAEARAKLKAAGIPVGERGRLSPAQMTQAARL